MHRLPRARFLSAVAGAASVLLPPATPAQPVHASVRAFRDRRGLVLSGGGARGAYQAGLIDYLVQSTGAKTGRALAPYGFVAGTSIGALNGYFVATGQYLALRDLWYRIADQRVIVLKPEYAKIGPTSDAGVGTKIVTAMRLAVGLSSSVKGVLDGEKLRQFLEKQIDPERPVLVPFIFTTTNLTRQLPEFFYMVPREAPEMRDIAITAVTNTAGPNAIVREATPDILIDALRASAAIPIAFDPVLLPGANGGMDTCVDGGVTANTPVGVARALASTLDIVLMDPPLEKVEYHNAFDIGAGVFGAMQSRILDADLRSAFLESFGKRAMRRTSNVFADQLLEVQLNVLRPVEDLPVSVIGFDQRELLFETYKRGFADAVKGFAPYQYRD